MGSPAMRRRDDASPGPHSRGSIRRARLRSCGGRLRHRGVPPLFSLPRRR
jgi:hypothetical protein